MPDPAPIPVAQDSDSPDIAWRPRPRLHRAEPPAALHGAPRHRHLRRPDRPARPTTSAWFWDAVVRRPGSGVVHALRARGRPVARHRVADAGSPAARYNYVHNAVDKHALRQRRDKPRRRSGKARTARSARSPTRELYARGRTGSPTRSRARHRQGRPGRHLHADGARDGRRHAGLLARSARSTSRSSPATAPRPSPRACSDCEAKLLITADGFYRRGQVVPMKETADEAVAPAPTRRARRSSCAASAARSPGPTAATSGGTRWSPASRADCATERTDAEDPYMIIYTSGTTGRPKGAVPRPRRLPDQGARRTWRTASTCRPATRLFWLTDMGWMMGPWLIGGSADARRDAASSTRATRTTPSPTASGQLVERHGVTVSASRRPAIRALMAPGRRAGPHEHDLSHACASSARPASRGTPSPGAGYFECVGGGRCPIINYSGGTEISGGIVSLPSPSAAQALLASARPIPGMAADVVDDEGTSGARRASASWSSATPGPA